MSIRKKAAEKRKRTIATQATLVIVACIAFAILLTTVVIPLQKLNKAKRLIDSGEYKAAHLLLDGMDYKNSRELRESIRTPYEKELLSEAEIGSCAVFGAYEQDNNASNGKEEIEWIVLAREGGRVLLISRYALDCQQYNEVYTCVTWETCSLREWLNGTFLSAAFSEEERAMIPSVTVSADKNPRFITSPGNSTTDQVFLLSITEANRYFSSDEARKCSPTPYAAAQGVWTSEWEEVDGKEACRWWWLRSPGSHSNDIVAVGSVGAINDCGIINYQGNGAVRPALWVDLGP